LDTQDNTTSSAGERFVIYSANEAATGDGAGFWSNEDGWVDDAGEPTLFTKDETQGFPLPITSGFDARFCPASDFGLSTHTPSNAGVVAAPAAEPQWFVLHRETREVVGEFADFLDGLRLLKSTPYGLMLSRRELAAAQAA
jgi:hypothetical protein